MGFADSEGRLQCNPYLIVDGDEAVAARISALRKVLQTGIQPSQFSHLVYQHYNPDLCGSIPILESIIDSPDLRIVSHAEQSLHSALRSEIAAAVHRQNGRNSLTVQPLLPCSIPGERHCTAS